VLYHSTAWMGKLLIPAGPTLRGIAGALKERGKRKVAWAVLPWLNHLYQTAVTGKGEAYDSIEVTLAPAAMERIATVVKKQK
jgi:hypothetical protein